ncbi:hypothetical protein RN001_008617 [Aquatica leii]|uniref:Kinesin motor domain-containing protein n=1 Tax=Aquatica leii TaxID=1421715 RepID=A0AAN7S9S0_9COLE|nr:hypothetical protein RN001_008617 [Aquatica leii]
MSVVLNRSSEENDNEDEENEGNVEDRLKDEDEIQQLQLKLKIQQDEMDKAKSESLDLDKILNEKKKSYLELKLKHETKVNLLKIEYDVYNDLILAAVLTREHEAELLIPNIGKTFTIVGTSEEPGIIPRSLEYLFRTLPTLPEVPLIKPNASGGISYMTEDDCLKDKMDRQILLSKHKNVDCALHKQTYKAMQDRLSNEPVGLIDQPLGPDVMLNVWVSFAEIYNENIYDLLKPHPCKGQSRQKLCLGNVNGDTYIKGLTSISVSSGLEAYLILQYGLHNTKNAATSVNSQSSSSHCVFTLKIAQASTTNKEEFVSVFNFCDLAGSERIKKTQNVGDRLKESNSINTSLLVLGRCIKLIRDNQKLKTSKVIPFRESKLTQLLQKALLGYESVWMIVNINTCREMFEETQHVLQFSAIAKDVVVEQQMLKACRTKKASELLDTQIDKMNVKELQEQIAFLSNELKQQRLDSEEDREHVIRSYKAIIDDTNKYWEKKFDETLRDVKHDIKRPGMSVVLNRSSEENDNEDEENEGNVEDRLKDEDEIQQLQLKLKIQQDEMDKAKSESLDLDKILNEKKKSYLELKLKHETKVNLLKIEYDVYNDLILAAVLTREHEAELLIPNIGKTFTIVGTSEEPGIIPRSLEYLFRTLPTLPEVPLIKPNASGGISYMTEDDCLKDKMDRQILLSKHKNVDCALHKQTYKAMQDRLSNEPVGLIDQPLGPDVMLNVWVSFAEIYNENIYDLLKPHPCKGQSRQKLCLGNVNGDTYIKGLTSISVSSGLEAYLILQYGLHNTKNAATSVNSQSSSSHCVFTLKIAQASTTNKEEFVSVFNFCDLAGSERIKKTQNVGDRLKESNSINTSLLVLGRCIKLIRDNQKLKTSKVIPFRESKLTQLLQKALLGYESVWMIVNINTCREMFEETQHVLQFSAIAKDVVVEQQMLKACRTKKASELLDTQIDKMNVKELQEQIAFLSNELNHQRFDSEADREHVIRSYKAIIDDTNKYWEKKFDETLRDVKHDIKRPGMSVVLNRSSEENDNEDEENEGNVEDRLKDEDEIQQLQLKLKIQQDEMDKAKSESLDLDKILNEKKKSYLELKLKHETKVNLLKSKIIANEKIKDLKKYLATRI